MAAPDLSLDVARVTQLPEAGVRAVLQLMADGATIPFVARYRKEATGSLDEVAIRQIDSAHKSALELEDRRASIRSSIEKQGKLTPKLDEAIQRASTKTALEDLYAPYKKKRRTRADQARELGLTPLAENIWAQASSGSPEEDAKSYLNDKVPDINAALSGATDILAERIAEQAQIKNKLRKLYIFEAQLSAQLAKGVDPEESKFADWHEFRQLAREIPSHRYLALDRGEREKQLRVKVEVDAEKALQILRETLNLNANSPYAFCLEQALSESYQRLLTPSLERELRAELKTRADEKAVEIFAANLKNLLLAAPFGPKTVLGVDPGLRTGAKCAVVSASGALLQHGTAFLVKGAADKERARNLLKEMVSLHSPAAIAVGNGTGGRETETFLKELVQNSGWSLPIVMVSEAGASVYSASEVAREELPDVDLTVRGAVSIARRLQDPLAELVKIDPAAIGVGQYQHDVKPSRLVEALNAVVEDCVHHVGVDLGTASSSLLARVSGVGAHLAQSIVAYRINQGGFNNRKELLKVKGLGKKAFEQAAGFLRIQGSYPLDRSAVHPERYALVEKMAKDLNVQLETLVGQPELAQKIRLENYVSDAIGLPTLKDIQTELGRPGRDPRDKFEAPAFRDDVQTMNDLEDGMELSGVVTNVTSFGAFVDIGVHQDGLVHISELSDKWISDPNEVVTVGQILKVRVLSVDTTRKRIALSCKANGGA